MDFIINLPKTINNRKAILVVDKSTKEHTLFLSPRNVMLKAQLEFCIERY